MNALKSLCEQEFNSKRLSMNFDDLAKFMLYSWTRRQEGNTAMIKVSSGKQHKYFYKSKE